MARIRSIKPEFFINEAVASLPFEWRLLFVGLWTQADREGRLLDRPLRLKAALFPYDTLDIDAGLSCLASKGLITRYAIGDQRLIAMPTWHKHQQPHIREAVSELPAPGASTVLAPVQPMGREGKGADQGREGVLARFDRFWATYPRKDAKDAARKCWLKLAPDEVLTERLLAALEVHKASPQWTRDEGQYIPHARTWLHNKRWEDEASTPPPTQRRAGFGASHATWACPHLELCGSQTVCRNAIAFNKPQKPGAVFVLDVNGVPRVAEDVSA